jgi:hypothetical protein
MADDKEPLEVMEEVDSNNILEYDEREVGIDDLGGMKSLTDAEDETPHQSDLQSVLKSLSPKFKNNRMNELLQPVMVSRIFPDNYLDLNYLLVMSMIEELEEDSDVDIVGIITGVQVGTSIGYEGRGIADRLEIAGVEQEQELEKMTKELGLS